MIDRISNIIRGLLLFSSRDQEKKHRVSLNEVIQESLFLTREKLRIKNIDLKFKVDNSLSDYLIEVDQKLLQEVITNLINNSYYFIKDDHSPWIEIEVFENKKRVSLTITDSGKEIDKKIQSKIFDPFFSTKEHGAGTGLGLSSSRGIIESFNGELTLIDSHHPSFLITLPIAA